MWGHLYWGQYMGQCGVRGLRLGRHSRSGMASDLGPFLLVLERADTLLVALAVLLEMRLEFPALLNERLVVLPPQLLVLLPRALRRARDLVLELVFLGLERAGLDLDSPIFLLQTWKKGPSTAVRTEVTLLVVLQAAA